MKKIVYGIMVSMLAISVLAACGEGDGDPGTNEPVGEPKEDGVME